MTDIDRELMHVLRARPLDAKWRRHYGYELAETSVLGLLADILPVVERYAAERAAEHWQRGYEQGRRDFQFRPEGDNHHNAALCPYCSPALATTRDVT